MLGPLDRLDVDALLHHLPQRAHLAQAVDVMGARVDGVVHFFLGAEPTDAEADGGVRHVLLHAERAQHVRGLEGGLVRVRVRVRARVGVRVRVRVGVGVKARVRVRVRVRVRLEGASHRGARRGLGLGL